MNRHQHESRGVGSNSVWDHSAQHAMTHRAAAATHRKIYRYLNGVHVAGVKSPLSKSFNCCSVQNLVTGASQHVDRCHSSIGTNVAQEKTVSGPVILPRM